MNRTTITLCCAFLLLAIMLPAGAQAQQAMTLTHRSAAEIAVRDNPMIQASRKDVEVAEKQFTKSWRQYFPTVTATARYQYLNDDIALGIPTISLPLGTTHVSLSLDPIHLLDRSTLRSYVSGFVPIFSGWRIESGIRAAKHNVREATAQDSLMLQKTIADALVSYNQVLLAAQNEDARTEAYATVLKHQHDVTRLCEQGVATQYDLLRATLAAEDANRALEEAKNQHLLATKQLKHVLQVPDSTELVLSDSLAFVEKSVDLGQALNEAQAMRPELHAIDEKQEVVRAASVAEIGSMLPQVGVFASYELNKNALTPLDPHWMVGVNATLTIFNGFKDLLSSQEYSIQAEKIDAIRTDAASGIALEVRKYYYDMQTARKSIVSAHTSVDLAQEALRMANRRFETGTGTSLEVIDAQTGVVASRTAYAAALFQFRSSYIQLVRALGRTQELLDGVF